MSEENDYLSSNLTRTFKFLTNVKDVKVLWMLSDPVGELLLSSNFSWLNNDKIDNYNSVVNSVFSSGSDQLEIWSSNRIIARNLGFPAIKYQCKPNDIIINQSEINFTHQANASNICVRPPNISDGIHISVVAADLVSSFRFRTKTCESYLPALKFTLVSNNAQKANYRFPKLQS
ncbi:N-acetylneuraminate 9-O-acetyltransferase [Cichlidogyrus casuarinus]|uniref:N-acetylneuraminate 9-O-acetyltransferase n=1 Tax=Cichlidogyrus casuarinus TaxID=1844966 RepID=A0ABD2Q5I2_9PLAT